MEWNAKIKPSKIRQLYHRSRIGRQSERLVLDVGWALHGLCQDVVTAALGLQLGEIPCPNCSAATFRPSLSKPNESDRKRLLQDHHRSGWFHCDSCQRRLLWQDCRDALKRLPKCLDCLSELAAADTGLTCSCGKTWEAKQYRTSVSRRTKLPCPSCATWLAKPQIQYQPSADGISHSRQSSLSCSKCDGEAQRDGSEVVCISCGHSVQWRSYKKALKLRDETIECSSCGHRFAWQAWRKEASHFTTGNPGPAATFLREWPKAKTADGQMMQIDLLIQSLHGQGALAPIFIEGSKESIRSLLDELNETS